MRSVVICHGDTAQLTFSPPSWWKRTFSKWEPSRFIVRLEDSSLGKPIDFHLDEVGITQGRLWKSLW